MNEIRKELDTWYHFRGRLAVTIEDFDLAETKIKQLEAILENEGPHPQLKLFEDEMGTV